MSNEIEREEITRGVKRKAVEVKADLIVLAVQINENLKKSIENLEICIKALEGKL